MNKVIKYKGKNGVGVYFTDSVNLSDAIKKVASEKEGKDLRVLTMDQYIKNFFLASETNLKERD